ELALVDDDALGEGRAVQALVNRAAVGKGEHGRHGGRRGAERRAAGGAGGAGAAGADECHEYPVALGIAGDSRTGAADMAGGFVAVDGRQIAAPAAVDVGDVGMADRAGSERHLDLAGAGRAQAHRLDAERLAEGLADGGADLGHGISCGCGVAGCRWRAGATSRITAAAIRTPERRKGAPGW